MPPRKTNATTLNASTTTAAGPATVSSSSAIRLAPGATFFSLDERENSFRAKGRPKKPAFPHQPSTHPRLSSNLLAQAGFYHTPDKTTNNVGDDGEEKDDDTCTCFLCHKKLGGWSQEDDPFIEHSRYEECPWVVLVCRNMVDSLNGGEGPKRTVFSNPDLLPSSAFMTAHRLRTYGDYWPHENPSSHSLARAGWVFAPSKKEPDNVWCPLCDYSVEDWESGDDPLEHHKKKADCPFFTATLVKSSSKGAKTKTEGRNAVQKSRDDSSAQPIVAEDEDEEPPTPATSKRGGRSRGRGPAREAKDTRGVRGDTRAGRGGRKKGEAEAEDEDEEGADEEETHEVVEVEEKSGPEAEPESEPEPKPRSNKTKLSITSSSNRSEGKGKGKGKNSQEDVEEVVEPVAEEREEEVVTAPSALPTESRATKPLPKKRGRQKALEEKTTVPVTTAADSSSKSKSSRRVPDKIASSDPFTDASTIVPVNLSNSTSASKSTSSKSKPQSAKPLDPSALAQELVKSPVASFKTTGVGLLSPIQSSTLPPISTEIEMDGVNGQNVGEGAASKRIATGVGQMALTDEQRDMTLEQFLRTEYGRQFDQLRKDGEESIKRWESRTKEARKRIEASI